MSVMLLCTQYFYAGIAGQAHNHNTAIFVVIVQHKPVFSPEFCFRGVHNDHFCLLIIHEGHRRSGNGKLQVFYDKKDTFTMSHVF